MRRESYYSKVLNTLATAIQNSFQIDELWNEMKGCKENLKAWVMHFPTLNYAVTSCVFLNFKIHVLITSSYDYTFIFLYYVIST